MLDLTIAIPAKNEALNLPGCLDAIGKDFARQVVVIDSGSIDDTKTIAENFGASVVSFVWNGKFPKKRNWWLQNYPPSTTWVMFLDADEYLTADFKTALTHALSNAGDKVGFWLRYTIYFLEKPLKGGYPLDKLALFKVGSGIYEKIDEDRWSHLDMEIHEHPILSGSTGRIKEKIDHRDYKGVQHYVAKHNEYAWWEANRFNNMMQSPDTVRGFTFKQKIKYSLMRTPLVGPLFFLGSFFLLKGFLDGKRGFAFALLKMGYFTQVYCRYCEIKQATNTKLKV